MRAAGNGPKHLTKGSWFDAGAAPKTAQRCGLYGGCYSGGGFVKAFHPPAPKNQRKIDPVVASGLMCAELARQRNNTDCA
jgi:hypothetical protein